MIVYQPISPFWKEIYPQGMTARDIDKELSDLEFVANELPKVYMHVTGDMASKPMYYAEVINSLHDDFVTRVVNEYLEEQKEEHDITVRYLENRISKLEAAIEKAKAKK